ncbi:toprim domain-containing protein, partial [Adonisia turfae]|uniref:toprim domain-containing protein n=1 Tax=Adonisia turfae TaxID=2950184 RepID=UPI002029ACBC
NRYHRLVPGSVRELGWFRIGTGQGSVQRVLLTESPIDAMSLAVLDKERRQQGGVTVYLSTDGTGGVPVEALNAVLQRNGQVVAAFDTDKAGELMAWRMAAQVPGLRRLRPAYGKDWNERLVHHGQPGQAQQTELDRRQLQPLWQWHQTAWKLGRSEKYLTRITEVATDVVRGKALSEKAQAAMQKDLAVGQKQAKQQTGNQTAQIL